MPFFTVIMPELLQKIFELTVRQSFVICISKEYIRLKLSILHKQRK